MQIAHWGFCRAIDTQSRCDNYYQTVYGIHFIYILFLRTKYYMFCLFQYTEKMNKLNEEFAKLGQNQYRDPDSNLWRFLDGLWGGCLLYLKRCSFRNMPQKSKIR